MNTAESMVREIRLSEILPSDILLAAEMDIVVSGIKQDSRKVVCGDVFIALKGARVDARELMPDVIAKGAKAILAEKGGMWQENAVIKGVPIVVIENLAARAGKIAACFYGHPAAKMTLIGITGTNGKTSCCQFIAQNLSELGKRCGVSGTLGAGLFGEDYTNSGDGPSTTPGAVDLQALYDTVLSRKAKAMVMEVSSHGLKQNRVNICEYDVAVFTNLSRDHLDYHGDMQAYGEAKRKLFTGAGLKAAIVNIDDVFSAVILNSLSRHVKAYTYSLTNPGADLHPLTLEFNPDGFAMDLSTPWGTANINAGLLGSFNASNLLASLATVLAVESQAKDFDFQKIIDAVVKTRPVRGRMELIGGEDVSVVVDYAHTPDGLLNALQALRQHFSGKISCVFGCGGDRDKSKRPLMAEIAERYADRLIITDDNPRLEPSQEIIRQILSGISKPDEVTVLSNRAAAIDRAIATASVGDVVLIAGKGHEEYQDVGGSRMAFSDVKQARLSLNRRFGGS